MNRHQVFLDGCTSTERIKYWKSVGPSTDTADPSHFDLKVLEVKISKTVMIGQMYELSDSVSCFLPKATFGAVSSSLGSPTTILLHTNLLSL